MSNTGGERLRMARSILLFLSATSNNWEYQNLPRNLNFSNRRMRTRMSGGVGGDGRG